MRPRTFPKENQKKLNETIRDLKALLRQQAKEIQFLKDELDHIMRPVRERKPHVDRNKMSHDEWRKDFMARYKKEVLGEKG